MYLLNIEVDVYISEYIYNNDFQCYAVTVL